MCSGTAEEERALEQAWQRALGMREVFREVPRLGSLVDDGHSLTPRLLSLASAISKISDSHGSETVGSLATPGRLSRGSSITECGGRSKKLRPEINQRVQAGTAEAAPLGTP